MSGIFARIRRGALGGGKPRAAAAHQPDEREIARPPHAGERRYAFITGCSRSGTTALTEIANRHPDVAIGFERFAHRAIAGDLAPELFEPARYRDFVEGDTHHRGREGYVSRSFRGIDLDKAHAVSVIGDKVPQLTFELDQLERFPGAKVVFIVREPYAVAKSFRDRAADESDGWRSDRGHSAAVEEFNESMASILRYAESGRPFLVLEYHSVFFARDLGDLLWRFLEVEPGRAAPLDDIYERSARSGNRRDDAGVSLDVAMSADFDSFRRVVEMSRQQRADALRT